MTELSLTPVTPGSLSLDASSAGSASLTGPSEVGDIPVWDGSGYDFLNYVADVRSFGAVGDGVTDDTEAIQAAIASLTSPITTNAFGGTVYLPAGEFLISDQITVPYQVHLRGAGRGEFLQSYGATTIISTYNGKAVLVPEGRYGWAISDLAITGDASATSQDLLVIGEGNSALPTVQGKVERVYVSKAGRDNIVVDDALAVHFDTVYCERANRYGLRVEGQSNGLLFNGFKSRMNKQWGVYWKGGLSAQMNACVIESNSTDTATSYGGMWIDPNDTDAGAHIGITMVGCHFENNVGLKSVSPTGVPLAISSGTRASTVNEIGTVYVETNSEPPCTIAGGEFNAIGIWSNLNTHAVVTGTTQPVVFINPRCAAAGGIFAVTDTGKVTRVLGSKEQYKVIASAAALTVPPGVEVVSVSGTTSITSMTASHAGRRVTLVFQDALTFTDGNNLKIAGNLVTTADDSISLVCDGTNWFETGRSVN